MPACDRREQVAASAAGRPGDNRAPGLAADIPAADRRAGGRRTRVAADNHLGDAPPDRRAAPVEPQARQAHSDRIRTVVVSLPRTPYVL